MLKQLIMILSLVAFFGALVLAQDNSETTNTEKQKCTKDSSGCCSKQNMHSDMKMESSTETTTATVQIWNKVCPVKGEEVDADSPTVEYNGKVIGFCCPGCDSKFQKDPEKYLKNLNEDGSKFIGKS
jgi:YHS domain-containing protein